MVIQSILWSNKKGAERLLFKCPVQWDVYALYVFEEGYLQPRTENTISNMNQSR